MSLSHFRQAAIITSEFAGLIFFASLLSSAKSDLARKEALLSFLKKGYTFSPQSLSHIILEKSKQLAENSVGYTENELVIKFKGLIQGFVNCPEYIVNYLGPKAKLIYSKIMIGRFNLSSLLFLLIKCYFFYIK